MNDVQGQRPPGLAAMLWTLRREFLVVGAFSAVVNLLMLTPTLYMLQVYDRVMLSQSTTTLLVVSAITLFLFALMGFAEWARARLLVRTSAKLDTQLSERVFKASFLSYLNPASEDPARAFSHWMALRQFVTGNGVFAFFDGPWVPIYLVVLYLLHPWLGALGLLFALLQLLVAGFGHGMLRARQSEVSQGHAQAQRFLHAKLRNVELISSMGMFDSLYARWRGLHHHAMRRAGDAQQRQSLIVGISKFLKLAQQSLGLGAGALLVIYGELTPGAMIAANVLMSRALGPIDLLVGAWPGFLQAKEAYGFLRDLLHRMPAARERLMTEAPVGHWSVQGLGVSVSGRSRALLDDVSVDFKPGSVTVVLGASGAGKSTLARCLLGIWPEHSGQVLLDGEDIRLWQRDSLGRHIGYLPQDVELFEGSVAENIARMGEVDSAQVIAAAQAAGVHDMVLSLPQGYDTPMGQAGGLLSGGQRQRVGLARALYGQPKLLVLDEPNANLDDQGEAALYAAVRAAKANGCTIVMISHRPSAIQAADRLLVLHGGKVLATGPRDGVLQALKQRQQQQAPAANLAAA